MTREEFLAQELLDEQEENRRLRDRIKWLTVSLAAIAAGPLQDVSPEQFSMLVHERDAVPQ